MKRLLSYGGVDVLNTIIIVNNFCLFLSSNTRGGGGEGKGLISSPKLQSIHYNNGNLRVCSLCVKLFHSSLKNETTT